MKTYAVCHKNKAWLGSFQQCLQRAKNICICEGEGVVKILKVRANEPAIIIFDVDKTGFYPVYSGRRLSYKILKKALKSGQEK